jgi:hypothetical protein
VSLIVENDYEFILRSVVAMLILVTSASGINGNGYGALLAFKRDGPLVGRFSDDSRIVDPRGLVVDQKEGLLFLNSGSDRVLALGPNGTIVRDTGRRYGWTPCADLLSRQVGRVSETARSTVWS